jgi:hypothetical protein
MRKTTQTLLVPFGRKISLGFSQLVKVGRDMGESLRGLDYGATRLLYGRCIREKKLILTRVFINKLLDDESLLIERFHISELGGYLWVLIKRKDHHRGCLIAKVGSMRKHGSKRLVILKLGLAFLKKSTQRLACVLTEMR